jgi:quaternary ammonium compound-resistance protein SugE
MPWVYLVFAGLLEIAWPPLLKASNGFTRPAATAVMLLTMMLSFWLLSLAVREIPVGTGYAIWTGIGAVGAAIMGMILYDEPRTVGRMVCIAVIIAGIAGLKLLSPTPSSAQLPGRETQGSRRSGASPRGLAFSRWDLVRRRHGWS